MGELFRYAPYYQTDPQVDAGRCRASVYVEGGRGRNHQCMRKPLDGSEWCRQHSPEAIEVRRQKSHERFERDQERSPWRTIEKLREQLSSALALVENAYRGGVHAGANCVQPGASLVLVSVDELWSFSETKKRLEELRG